MDREDLLAIGMLEPIAEKCGDHIRLRPFTIGSMQMAYLLGISAVTNKEAELDDAERIRQKCAIAWMQSTPEAEVWEAVKNSTWSEKIFDFAMGLPIGALEEIQAEIERIEALIGASTVRVESKHSPSDKEDAPGKS
jgi:hypothetical protein